MPEPCIVILPLPLMLPAKLPLVFTVRVAAAQVDVAAGRTAAESVLTVTLLLLVKQQHAGRIGQG